MRSGTSTCCVNPPGRVTVSGVYRCAERLASDSHLSGFSVQTRAVCLIAPLPSLHATKGLKLHQRAEKAIMFPGLSQMIARHWLHCTKQKSWRKLERAFLVLFSSKCIHQLIGKKMLKMKVRYEVQIMCLNAGAIKATFILLKKKALFTLLNVTWMYCTSCQGYLNNQSVLLTHTSVIINQAFKLYSYNAFHTNCV